MTAVKIKIEDTYVFEQVARVIGKNQARIELFKASKSWKTNDIVKIVEGENILTAFGWSRTIQGDVFWEDIYLQISK